MELKNYFIKTLRWGLLSLVVVALFGTLMRYKIAFDFPFFNQKFLLHAHSHFAFSGWVSHFLYCGLFYMVSKHIKPSRFKVYKRLINFNMVVAFGMLFAFTAQGYKVFSICFSTLTILIAVLFCVHFFKDVKSSGLKLSWVSWAKTGLVLNAISYMGPLYLAYMMMSKNINSDYYLASVYYFLHFQYSGWFFFGAMALGIHLLPEGIFNFKKYFNVFLVSVVPTYFLSILWADLPLWLYIITVIASVAQWAAWVYLFFKLRRTIQKIHSGFQLSRILFYIAAAALTLKFTLQMVSVVPSLSQLVFGFRPIVIGYLHLVLLGVYSLFLIGYLIHTKSIQLNAWAKFGVIGFLVGVFLNELFLGIQGVASFTYTPIPFINEFLLFAALVLFSSATGLFVSQLKSGDRNSI